LFLFAVLHHFCQYFDPFVIKIGAADISALFKTTKAPKKWQNDAKRAKRSKCLAPGLNLALALHLVQSYIYPGATFSTVPAKRYECPSLICNFLQAKRKLAADGCQDSQHCAKLVIFSFLFLIFCTVL